MLRVAEAAPELFERQQARLVADVAKRPFEIFDQREAEGLVRDRPGDDIVELTAAPRQLLGGSHPTFGCRGKRPQKLGEPLFVVSSGRGHRLQDGSGAAFLPSRISRSFARHREMRLAIVPEGISSVSPIVW